MKIFYRVLFLYGFSLLIFINIQAQENWEKIKTVKDLYNSYPELLKGLFHKLNLGNQGLELVKLEYEKGEIVNASELLIEYYKKTKHSKHLKKTLPEESNKTIASTDTILQNVFTIQNVRGQLPTLENGHRDWDYTGPNNDKEWAWLSNRHTQLIEVFHTYLKTGNPKYAQYIDGFLKDFIIYSLPYPAEYSFTAIWRGLEVSFRAKRWTDIFYGLIQCDEISTVTKLLILCSLPDHAHFNRHFHAKGNWLTMEISALAKVAANFPEFKDSDEWFNYAMQTITESMKQQVYESGIQKELTAHYHVVALNNFEEFAQICKNADKELPDYFRNTLEKMYNYSCVTIRPDGGRILNNDGDRENEKRFIIKASKKFENKEWEYIATNGQSGRKPKNGPSYFFPDAGQLISRSGFEADAHWSFFDVGPMGISHFHKDKLHISVSAFGKDFLVDAGRFAYTGQVAKKFREYCLSSGAHNVIHIDGHGQDEDIREYVVPLDSSHYQLTDTFDYASNTMGKFLDMPAELKHTRAVLYVRGEFWVVVDRIQTDKSRKIEALWHWNPECDIETDNSIVTGSLSVGNLSVVPMSKQEFKIDHIKGQDDPVQGWYSPEYNKYMPNETSIYTSHINNTSNIVWLIVPRKEGNEVPNSKILAETKDGVEIEVQYNKKSWFIHVPYAQSAKAAVKQR